MNKTEMDTSHHRNGSQQSVNRAPARQTSSEFFARTISMLRHIEWLSSRINMRAHEPLHEALAFVAELLREALVFVGSDSRKSVKFLCRVYSNLQMVKSDIDDCIRYDLEGRGR